MLNVHVKYHQNLCYKIKSTFKSLSLRFISSVRENEFLNFKHYGQHIIHVNIQMIVASIKAEVNGNMVYEYNEFLSLDYIHHLFATFNLKSL